MPTMTMLRDEGSCPALARPVQVGNLTLSHRIVMAPMTRLRSSDEHVPLDMAGTYYSQRASSPGTLLITEATFISAESRGRDKNAPGIFTPEQISQWRTIVDGVHEWNSFVFCQLWHVGRAARRAEIQRLGLPCLSSSDVPLHAPYSSSSAEAFATPRDMTEDEIEQTIASFALAASNAVHGAGFDGVEIHAANGYLIDQFTQPSCNQRTDKWGRSIENRARFCLEVVRAVCRCVDSQKVGVRLSPFSRFQGMGMDDPKPQFRYIVEQLSTMGLAYLHLVEPRVDGNVDRNPGNDDSLQFAVHTWAGAGPVILAGGYTPSSAESAVGGAESNQQILIAFGRHFISNPDLPYRILNGLDLTPYDRDTFYKVGSADGYIDYEPWCA